MKESAVKLCINQENRDKEKCPTGFDSHCLKYMLAVFNSQTSAIPSPHERKQGPCECSNCLTGYVCNSKPPREPADILPEHTRSSDGRVVMRSRNIIAECYEQPVSKCKHHTRQHPLEDNQEASAKNFEC